ncbi:MAG: NAD-dependent epimerase/dehydratase family protein [Clostridiaceae bacterium]|nr:NAD-dependent epimerase/dehydratase family protein [Clostridiaceae bacterium]
MILVTGATGHIGNVLVHQLAAAYPQETIRIFLQPNERLDAFDGLALELYYGDIRKEADVRRAVNGARLVFHLAGLIETAPRRPQLLQQVNIGGTRHIVEACLAYPVERLIYVSSVHALPDLPDGQMITEIKDFSCSTLLGPYAQTKSAATAAVYDGISRGLDAVVVFPSGVIGPFDYKMSEMGRLIRYLSRQGRLKLVMSFDGAYDFVDVRDVVGGLLAAARVGRSGEGYILSGHRVTMRQIIRLEREALGQYQPRIFFAPKWMVRAAAWLTHGFCRVFGLKPFFTPYSVSVLQSNCNISHEKAHSELGFDPRPLLDTFRDSILWMKEHGQIRRARQPAAKMSRSTNI